MDILETNLEISARCFTVARNKLYHLTDVVVGGL